MTTALDGKVSRDGFDLHYESVGGGEPLLLLAGGPGLSVEYLRPVAEALADRHRCIMLHPRGTGRSPLPVLDETTVNMAASVADVEALREALGLEDWAVLGHSFGGMWAMAYAAAFPRRIRRLALAAPGGMDLGFFAYFLDNILARLTSWERETYAYWTDPIRVEADPDCARHEQAGIIAPAFFWSRDPVPAYVHGLRGWLAPRVEALMLQSLSEGGYGVREAMGTFTAPTLIVQGRQDPLGDGLAWQTYSTFPNAVLTFIDRCGHYPWQEQPKAFYAAVRAFLVS